MSQRGKNNKINRLIRQQPGGAKLIELIGHWQQKRRAMEKNEAGEEAVQIALDAETDLHDLRDEMAEELSP